MTTSTARCPGAARLRSRWTMRSLVGAFIDLALAWTFLCAAAVVAAADRLLTLLGLPLLCTCARPHLPCLLAFLARYPARALHHIHASLRSRFPFHDDQRQRQEVPAAPDGDLQRVDLQRELEKERSASASAAEEAMAMILRLQKEKSSLEIDARQQRRAAEERSAFVEVELEELRDIVLLREREARALRKEVDAYRRLLGLAPEDEDDDEDDVMVTPFSVIPESQPSSSRSVAAHLRNDSAGFSFQSPFLGRKLVTPVRLDLVKKGIGDDRVAVQTPTQVPAVEPKQEQLDRCKDGGAETVEILPLSARSLGFDQGCDFHVGSTAGTEEEHATDEFQKGGCGGLDKTSNDHSSSENDSSIFDVHVIDDMCFSKEVKGLIGRSFSDATMQTEKFQTRAAADDLLVKSLNAVKGAQDKIKLAASQRRESLQLQLLEDIASQLQGIKDAAEADRHLYSASPKNSKKN